MIAYKLNNVLFTTAGLFFVFTLLFHFTGSGQTDDAEYQSYSKAFASKVIPSFAGGDNLGSVRSYLARSERQYQDTLEGRKWLNTQWEDQASKIFFPGDSPAHYWTMPFTIWDFFPASFNCPHSTQRLGRMGDGGKWFCGIERLATLPRDHKARPEAASGPTAEQKIHQLMKPRPDAPENVKHAAGTQAGCIIYSFGVQNESSFEEAIMKQTPHCEVWGYDFTVDSFGPQLTEVAAGRTHFARLGLSDKTELDKPNSPPFASVQDLMAANGHDHIDVIKMDIEGSEFMVMDSLVAHFRGAGKEVPVGQFLVEIHLRPNDIDVERFTKWWENLESVGFRPVWTEPNLLVTTLGLHDKMPRYSEYTFLNIKDSKSPFLK